MVAGFWSKLVSYLIYHHSYFFNFTTSVFFFKGPHFIYSYVRCSGIDIISFHNKINSHDLILDYWVV